MTAQHTTLAAGRWFELSLAEQMGNIGSEVHRAAAALQKNKEDFELAFHRALELFDLTLADPRWRNRLKEIARAREFLCGVFLNQKEYGSSFEDLDRYFLQFAVAARLAK